MGEIKLRAWDVENKRMLSPDELYKQGFYWIPDGRGFMQWKTGEIFTPELENKYVNHLIPLLYTGSNDKNGKEIYEGDITRSKVNECIWLYEIKQVEGFGNNLYQVTRYRNFATNNDTDFYIWGDYWVNEGRSEIPSWCEVIGNIYETPKLLKELEKSSVGDV